MMFIFSFSIVLIIYTYLGYPLHIWLLARFFPQTVKKADPAKVDHDVTVIISAKNEALQLEKRINNIFDQDYPSELIEVIIISDGSTDDTVNIVEQLISKSPNWNIRLIIFDESHGKPSALNAGIKLASSNFILFADCRQSFEPDVIRQLLANFNDLSIGAVSGELKFWEDSKSHIKAEMGAYWKYEKFVRKNESLSGSVVGATGAIYAIRTELYQQLPAETLIDDVLTPLNIAKQGKRIIFDSSAIAYDVASSDTAKEWHRKVRTLAGNWQLITLFNGLFYPSRNPLLWRFIGHKFLRLLVPFALIGVFASSVLLDGWFFGMLVAMQIAFYGSAAVAHLSLKFRTIRIIKTIYFFVVLNFAALVGFIRWITGRCDTAWHPVVVKK